jgi:ABC-type antimicrobial peptide transport system permease subunit
VVHREREIGIRIAIGAQVADIARGVTRYVFFMVCVGSLVGFALGMILVHHAETLLYEVKSTNPMMLAIPVSTILLASLLAAVPAVVRALRIDQWRCCVPNNINGRDRGYPDYRASAPPPSRL